MILGFLTYLRCISPIFQYVQEGQNRLILQLLRFHSWGVLLVHPSVIFFPSVWVICLSKYPYLTENKTNQRISSHPFLFTIFSAKRNSWNGLCHTGLEALLSKIKVSIHGIGVFGMVIPVWWWNGVAKPVEMGETILF